MNATLSAGTRSAVPTSVEPPAAVPAVVRVTIALSGAFLAGVLTAFGQAVPALAPVSNSAGPWFVVAALLCLVAGARAGPDRPAAGDGARRRAPRTHARRVLGHDGPARVPGRVVDHEPVGAARGPGRTAGRSGRRGRALR
ncbi:DUF6518 family protein [Curtobacterium flaccumfaciens]|nr:DUF6518 family protein [Curtobacterium flaccumfaciens]